MVLLQLQDQLEREGLLKVKDFWVENGEANPIRKWNLVEWFERKSPDEVMEGLVQTLEDRNIDTRAGLDRIHWGYRTKCQCNVKEAVDLAGRVSQVPSEKRWCKLWGLGLWIKITLFLWLLLRGRILTWKNMRQQGMLGPLICVMCTKDDETTDHLLQGCD